MITRSFSRIFLIIVLFTFALTSLASAADVKIKFTDKSRIKYEGDWLSISYQAYTSKTVGSGGRKGIATCKPNLTGTYQIIAEFKATVNRGNKAIYFVNGTKAKEVDQRSGVVGGKSAFPKVSLGVFELTPESTVELRAQDGKSYSLVSYTFTTSTDVPKDAIAGDTAAGGTPGDTAAESSFTAKRDGDMVIEPFLSTYSAAEFHVAVDGKEVFSWVRSNDSANEPCVFNGAADEKSMTEVEPGDYSPTSGLKYTMALKAGQKVTSSKSGNYEGASFLKISGPFDGAAEATKDKKTADKDTKAVTADDKDATDDTKDTATDTKAITEPASTAGDKPATAGTSAKTGATEKTAAPGTNAGKTTTTTPSSADDVLNGN
ncbi:MAG: hypothetical protein KKB51_19475 [Candidatus Riflebacteria bacterium]|nr:hypothetical protein [Candidatus Riflebacteria bacterium]